MLCPSCGDDANPPDAKFCEGLRRVARRRRRIPSAGLPVRKARPRRRRLLPDLRPEARQDLRRGGVGAGLRRHARLASDKGRRHPTNQDFGLVARRADGAALIVVADGVSASDNPEAPRALLRRRPRRRSSRAALPAIRYRPRPPRSPSKRPTPSSRRRSPSKCQRRGGVDDRNCSCARKCGERRARRRRRLGRRQPRLCRRRQRARNLSDA